MGLGVLLVPALAGYLFLNWFNGTRYSLPRETGYHVVFRAAIVGVFLFFIARLCVLLANILIPQIGQSWKTVVPLDYSGTAAATIVLAALLPLVLNQFPRYDRFQAQQKAAVAAGDQISLIIDQAILQGRFVELSPDNRGGICPQDLAMPSQLPLATLAINSSLSRRPSSRLLVPSP